MWEFVGYIYIKVTNFCIQKPADYSCGSGPIYNIFSWVPLFLRQIVNENDRPLLVDAYKVVEHGGKFYLSQQEPIEVANN